MIEMSPPPCTTPLWKPPDRLLAKIAQHNCRKDGHAYGPKPLWRLRPQQFEGHAMYRTGYGVESLPKSHDQDSHQSKPCEENLKCLSAGYPVGPNPRQFTCSCNSVCFLLTVDNWFGLLYSRCTFPPVRNWMWSFLLTVTPISKNDDPERGFSELCPPGFTKLPGGVFLRSWSCAYPLGKQGQSWQTPLPGLSKPSAGQSPPAFCIRRA